MRKQLEKRLNVLKTEFESGQAMMTELQNRLANLRETLLRINGAIQVIEEELKKESEQTESQDKVYPLEKMEISKP